MDTSPVVVDVETAPLPNAADYFEPVEPDARLVDPVKIAASIAAKTEAQQSKAGLDWNVGRIAALAWWTEDDGVIVRLCPEEPDEALALTEFWRVSRHRPILGFNIKSFDLRFLVQRSRLLGVAHPILDLGRFSKGSIIDLYSELTFNDSQDTWCMRRTLHAFCRRFGIPVTDTAQGKDMPALIAVGDWAAVEAHVASDVLLTVELARKLRMIASVPKIYEVKA